MCPLARMCDPLGRRFVMSAFTDRFEHPGRYPPALETVPATCGTAPAPFPNRPLRSLADMRGRGLPCLSAARLSPCRRDPRPC